MGEVRGFRCLIWRMALGAAMLALAASALGRSAGAAEAKRPPNFIVILADDLGAKELACYGNAEHQTPNLDSLAKTGVLFKTCYATPVCHPTRFEIMTGQYGCHNGIFNFGGKRGGPEPGDPVEDITNHLTFAQLLKSKGYATALVGKWQLSGRQPTLIHEAGFDDYCAWAYGNYYDGEEKEKTLRDKVDYRSRYWKPSIMINGKYVPTTINDYGPDITTDYLIDWMKQKKDQPFFIYFTMLLTHGPWNPTPDSVKSDEDKFKAGKENFKADVEY
ncbi:MAG: sulfatase-like hydrolase/transferase, partial [Candidatus Sumerlaeota bacterium]|nr:sulfatase-like hydrolase/transferase [Candidatus Sumerlaeota bacterium]